MKKIVAFGVFDILHIGHVKFLEACKKIDKYSELTVVISRDSTVLKEKGKKPIISEEERRQIIESLKSVNKAVLGYEGSDKFRIVRELKPDIIVLGYDQKWDETDLKKQLEEIGLKTEVIRLKKYENINSTSVKNRLKI